MTTSFAFSGRATAAVCLLALSGSLLCAQGYVKGQETCVWRDGELILLPRDISRTGISGELHDASGKKRFIPRPPRENATGKAFGRSYGMGVQVAEDRIHYLHADVLDTPAKERGKPGKELKVSVYRFDENVWNWEAKPRGTLTWQAGMTPYLLREDLILGVATSANSFTKGGEPHLFALFRKDESGKFRLDTCLDGGLEKSVFMPDKSWRYPSLSTLWLAGRTARSSRLFVLASGSGTCWVFDVRTGSLKSVVQLYREVNDAKLAAGEVWDGALLGIQPKASGDFLLSALDGYAVTQGWHLEQGQRNLPSHMPAGERYGLIQQSMGEILRLNPRVDWYVLDSERKGFRPEQPPQGLPGTLRTLEDYQGFDWVFKADGNLAFRREAPAVPKEAEGGKTGGKEGRGTKARR